MKQKSAKTSPQKIKNVGFVIKHHQPSAQALAEELIQIAIDHQVNVYIATESKSFCNHLQKSYQKKQTHLKNSPKNKAKNLAQIYCIEKPDLAQACDLITVLGGDGTFLSIARLMNKESKPLLGINMGTLGFLTEINHQESKEVFTRILEGQKYKTSTRALLEVTLKRNQKMIYQGPVVNDVVISKGAIARIIGMNISIDHQVINTVRADGLIISTPSGSTAYALAAGGPIVQPTLNAMILAPICPHSLTQRPMVLSDDLEVKITLTHRPGHVLLTLDGQDAIDLKEGDEVIITRNQKQTLKLIQNPKRDYFGLLREKLSFGNKDQNT